MCIATIQKLNYSRQESKEQSRKYNLQFIFLTHVTLKQSQGHQTYNEYVDPEQGYKHAKYERSRFNSVQRKVTFKDFSSNEEICPLSPLNISVNQK